MAYENKTGLPSVTEIIGKVCAAWIPSEYFTEESRARGSAVHEYAAAYVTTGYAVPLRPEWQGYVDSFCRWADAHLDWIVIAEERLIDPRYGYCGQLDLFCKIKKRPGLGVIDLKTGAQDKTHALQVAAYRNLADLHQKKKLKPTTSWGAILPLKANGGMPKPDFKEKYELDLNRFLGALNLFKHFA